jgi:hypothetical protein
LVQDLYHNSDRDSFYYTLSESLSLSDAQSNTNRVWKWLLYRNTDPDGHRVGDGL